VVYVVRWSPRALEDVDAIAEYIEKDSPFYAKAVVAKIIAISRRLEDFPFSGRIVPEAGDSVLREHFVFSYRIIYRIEEKNVTIAAVVHGKQLLMIDDQEI
jgi:toxin ParE1/3/4